MLKVALVGVGGISGAHIPAWESMDDAELVAICDIRPERMENYPDKRHYTDFDEMLEKRMLIFSTSACLRSCTLILRSRRWRKASMSYARSPYRSSARMFRGYIRPLKRTMSAS